MFWKLAAKIMATPMVFEFLRKRAMKTPYYHIQRPGEPGVYMYRYWLFNAYSKVGQRERIKPRFPWLPSIRLHHICLPDNDRHEHDHPFVARSLILKGYYVEERRTHNLPTRVMCAGDTNSIHPGDYHRITSVSAGGVWTMFLTFGHNDNWGFMVDGKHVSSKTYETGRQK